MRRCAAAITRAVVWRVALAASSGKIAGWDGTTATRVTMPTQIVPPRGVTRTLVTAAGATPYAIDSAGNL